LNSFEIYPKKDFPYLSEFYVYEVNASRIIPSIAYLTNRRFTMAFTSILGQLKRVICLGLLAAVLCAGFTLSWSHPAYANNPAGRVVQERAERELDRKSGAGTANQLKGQVQEGVGKVQRQFDNDFEGTANELEGKARKNVGRAQQATEDAAQSAQESAESLIDRVKDFVGQ
jgi:uncharacterized protein YjbJ (UPF0337 family)